MGRKVSFQLLWIGLTRLRIRLRRDNGITEGRRCLCGEDGSIDHRDVLQTPTWDAELKGHAARRRCRIRYLRIAAAERKTGDHGNGFSREQRRSTERRR